jgi:hypothetical protein
MVGLQAARTAMVYDASMSGSERKLRSMPLFYPRRVTTGAVATTAVLSTLVARALLPQSARPAGWLPILIASGGAYLALRVGSYSGLSKQFKHRYLDWFAGEVDDAQTWMVAALGGAGTLVALGQIRRALQARE